jgi:Spy/CpxP family protein refolding chaperone
VVKVFITLILGSLALSLHAQSPYSGQQTREIKALSQSEIEGYLSGKGMGLAKAAELNSYPGPKHVLDLADQLELNRDQLAQTQDLFNTMKSEASALGIQLIDKERELDQLYSNHTIDGEQLKLLVADIGELQSGIRYVHLQVHLEQRQLLSKHQTKLYNKLRGYHLNDGEKHSHHH